MPKSAIDTGKIDKVLTLSEISDFINYLLKNTKQLKRRIS
jgi:chemotaxis response regulator CheB